MICVGGDEPEGWIAQSRSYFELCDSQNNIVDFKIVEGTNHFSLLDHSMNEDYELNKEVIEFGRIIKETINSYINVYQHSVLPEAIYCFESATKLFQEMNKVDPYIGTDMEGKD